MKYIDIDAWNRKEHYQFFSAMKSPSFGMTADVKCTKAYETAKKEGFSFFAYYLYLSIKTVNRIPEFRYRIGDGKVCEYNVINAAATIAREDHTFAFIFVPYDEDFAVFNKSLQEEILAVKNSSGLRMHDKHLEPNLIRYTAVPWIQFTGLLHPTNFNSNDAVPRISFGKVYEHAGEKFMPVSVEAHHGLMDGFHMGEYFRLFGEMLEGIQC